MRAKTAAQPPSQLPSSIGKLLLHSALPAALGFLLAVPIVPHFGRTKPPVQASGTASATQDDASTLRKPGPWGKVRASRIMVEAPSAAVEVRHNGKLPWFIAAQTAHEAAAVFADIEMAPEHRRYFANPANYRRTDNGITISPPVEMVLGLKPDARAKLYSRLGAWVENALIYDPFRFRSEEFRDWFFRSGLKPETLSLIEPLCYRRGSSWVFADIDSVLELVPLMAERVKLVKTLSRRSALSLQIRVDAETDVEALAAYWGRGPRTRDIRTLIDSASRTPGRGLWVDVVHFLPRLPRMLVNTFPAPSDAGAGTYLDCHWTAFNFFRPPNQTLFEDTAEVAEALSSMYREVAGAPMFGDIVCFVQADGSIIHSSVYIADNIVYTKNGMSAMTPWVLMEMEDVLSFYMVVKPDIQTRVYRMLGT